ncbi:unnamed protein product [Pleuronectes platessa]|uniref:Uncharacterized protein n=1 Tax=Pleuronectes platessa TaxID=8262 RepID=A0A9N7VJA9_PLEPL|nr:unnamed protein product [Pleuronectes platessa]
MSIRGGEPSLPSMPLSPCSGEGCSNLSSLSVQTSDGRGHRLSPSVRLARSVLIEESPQIRTQFIPERPRRILIDVKIQGLFKDFPGLTPSNQRTQHEGVAGTDRVAEEKRSPEDHQSKEDQACARGIIFIRNGLIDWGTIPLERLEKVLENLKLARLEVLKKSLNEARPEPEEEREEMEAEVLSGRCDRSGQKADVIGCGRSWTEEQLRSSRWNMGGPRQELGHETEEWDLNADVPLDLTPNTPPPPPSRSSSSSSLFILPQGSAIRYKKGSWTKGPSVIEADFSVRVLLSPGGAVTTFPPVNCGCGCQEVCDTKPLQEEKQGHKLSNISTGDERRGGPQPCLLCVRVWNSRLDVWPRVDTQRQASAGVSCYCTSAPGPPPPPPPPPPPLLLLDPGADSSLLQAHIGPGSYHGATQEI